MTTMRLALLLACFLAACVGEEASAPSGTAGSRHPALLRPSEAREKAPD